MLPCAQRHVKMPFLCCLGAGQNQQMVGPIDLCHQWCHKFIILVSFVELLHTIEPTAIKAFDARVLLRNVCGNFVNNLIAKAQTNTHRRSNTSG